ncbi:glycosyltransferase [Rhodanobacter sp. Si-c]|uniref:Glycosyltransferase n=1 Tax=Rhodanobacter lycopersici TaxID=3162487 RepID=A0ABV3QC12_9GAMM
MTTNSPRISVISPVYGCAECLHTLCSDISVALLQLAAPYEIILVCDGSPDDSWRHIETLAANDERIRGIRLTRNFGQHCAIAAGLEHSRGDWVVVLDCDLQDPPSAIPDLYAKALEGNDAVFAVREDRKDGFFKRLSSRAFFATLSYLTETSHDYRTANFGIFSSRVIQAINAMPERKRFFPLMVNWTGFRTARISVDHGERKHGESSYSLGKLLRLAMDIILSYSEKPLRLVAKSGLLFSMLSFVFVAISIFRYAHGDVAVAGYTSIMASIWLVGGMTIFSLGIVGIYVGRIFHDIKKRPYYVVDKLLNFSDSTKIANKDETC